MKHKKTDSEYADHCRRELNLSPHTIASYTKTIELFWEMIPEDDPRKVDRNAVTAYLRMLGERYSPSSAKHHFGVVKKYFEYLAEAGLIKESPFENMKARMRGVQKAPVSMSVDEVARLLNAAYSGRPDSEFEEFIYLRDCTILEFLFATGMRIQELCSVHLPDFNLETWIIEVMGKGRRQRRCFVASEEAREICTRYLESRADYLKKKGARNDLLFIGRNCLGLSTQAARNLVKKYVKKAGIEKNITPHSFRHTFATTLIEQGVELSYIQKYLGHSTISTTQLYLHISDSSAMDVLKAHHPREQMEVLHADLDRELDEAGD